MGSQARDGRSTLIVASAVVLAILGASVSAWADWPFDVGALREDDTNPIRAANGRVVRDGNRLSVRLATGEWRTFQNADMCENTEIRGDNCVRHAFVEYNAQQHVYLIMHTYWEWGDFTAIWEDTGQSELLMDYPHFSPSGNRFVVVSNHDCCNTNGLQVWDRVGSGFRLIWSMDGQKMDYGSEFVRWVNETRVEMKFQTRKDGRLEGINNADIQLARNQWIVSHRERTSQ